MPDTTIGGIFMPDYAGNKHKLGQDALARNERLMKLAVSLKEVDIRKKTFQMEKEEKERKKALDATKFLTAALANTKVNNPRSLQQTLDSVRQMYPEVARQFELNNPEALKKGLTQEQKDAGLRQFMMMSNKLTLSKDSQAVYEYLQRPPRDQKEYLEALTAISQTKQAGREPKGFETWITPQGKSVNVRIGDEPPKGSRKYKEMPKPKQPAAVGPMTKLKLDAWERVYSGTESDADRKLLNLEDDPYLLKAASFVASDIQSMTLSLEQKIKKTQDIADILRGREEKPVQAGGQQFTQEQFEQSVQAQYPGAYKAEDGNWYVKIGLKINRIQPKGSKPRELEGTQ